MSLLDPCLIRSRGPSGQVVVRLGVPLVDDYLEFMEGRCRPNTVLAAAYDLRVFFASVDKAPAEVVPADVLGFITAQRTGRSNGAELRAVDDEPCGVAMMTLAEIPQGCSLRVPTLGGRHCSGRRVPVAAWRSASFLAWWSRRR